MSEVGVSQTFAGRYSIVRSIGTGGMGEVLCAWDPDLDRPVAIKVLPERLAGQPRLVERFRAEAQAAAKLSHPCVVQVYDTGFDRGSYYIVMEYVDGTDLRQVLGARKALAPAQAAAVLDQLLKGLEAAHGAGLVHRDIKPENIMLTPAGEVKITDFGIARMAKESGVTREAMGTAAYVSPEQIRGEVLDGRADLYSAGCVLYELLCGAPPFGGDLEHVLREHLESSVPVPSLGRPGAAPLDRVVSRATQRDPALRYETAAAMRADLIEAAAPLGATPPLGELAQELTTRLSLDGYQMTRVPTAGQAEHRGPRWWRWGLVAALGLILVAAAVLVRSLPKVTGMRQSAAMSRLRQAGLHGSVHTAFSDSVPAGTVMSERPALISVGSLGLRGGSVALTVSKGPDVVALPYEVGQPLATAQRAIQALGLPLAPPALVNSSATTGTVIAQVPGASTGPISVRPGTPVNLTVSKGPQLVSVPSVTGTFSAAATVLQQAGLTVTRQDVYAAAPAGTVVSQAPPAGAAITAGQPVTLVVSKGPQPFPMPSVRGLACATAQSQLQADGLTVGVVHSSGGSGCSSATVLEQDPVSGIPVQKGTQATLYVP